ncbi:hypothetical protein AYJ66_17105 [Dietzia cinnamea]|nr:hypothetical protein AYJ66_17105 [Dietzia cinnamea]
MKIVQITDTHNSAHGGISNENLVKMIEFVNELEPDLVVHTGDVSILDPDNEADRATAARLLGELKAPLRVLPGNHDIGEPGEAPFGGAGVTSARVAAFRAVFGDDRWVEYIGGFSVVGFNSELMSSGLPEEEEQWAWLESLPAQLEGRPTIIFCHKPVHAPAPGLPASTYSIAPQSLDRLRSIVDNIDVQAFGSGHLHRWALEFHDGVQSISAPSTAFVYPGAEGQFGPSLSQLGIVEYQLTEDGGVTPFFRARPDLAEHYAVNVDTLRLALEEMGIDMSTLDITVRDVLRIAGF